MANFISRGDADQASIKQTAIDSEQVVTFKNRFGRELDILRYHAKKMQRRAEGQIVADPSPMYEELLELRALYTEQTGNEPLLKWSSIKIKGMLKQAKEKQPADNEKETLTAQYIEKFGNKPHHMLGIEKLKEKLSE